MKRLLVSSLFIFLGVTGICSVSEAAISAAQKAPAYQKYQNRPKTELSKLIYLMDLFKGSDYKVVFNKMEYDSTAALQSVKNYIAKHYHNENALKWITQHSYRSPEGQIIYLKGVEGKPEILRDALTRELKALA